jgi:hypothetical protein
MVSQKQIASFICKWKLNQTLLAEKIGMPLGSFKKKISANQTAYRFTLSEIEKLHSVISEMISDYQN